MLSVPLMQLLASPAFNVLVVCEGHTVSPQIRTLLQSIGKSTLPEFILVYVFDFAQLPTLYSHHRSERQHDNIDCSQNIVAYLDSKQQQPKN